MKKILLLVFIVTLIASCGAMVPPRDPYTLYVHLQSEPDTLNPIIATDAYASEINEYIFETMVELHRDSLDLTPKLAKSWTISKNKRRFVFYLKKGILWSDGKEFTSDDVIYSFMRIMDKKVKSARLKGYYKDVKRYRAIDRYTVEFIYNKSYFLALQLLGDIPIVPKHIYDDGTDFNGHSYNRKPIGTGPYKIKEWKTGQRIVLTRNEIYRGKKPDIKNIVFSIIDEQHVALQKLKKGELDFIQLKSYQWKKQTQSKKFNMLFKKVKYPYRSYSYIGWNAKSIYFKDSRVRMAMTHMINRKEILEKLSYGLGRITTGNFYILSKSYNKNIKPWPYDPKKGRKLLAEAGWKDTDKDGILDKNGKKFIFTITIPSGSASAERLSTIIKEDFSKDGIEVHINKFEWSVFITNVVHKRAFEAVILGWSLGFTGDPHQVWHSSQIKKGSNYVSFSNREADIIIDSARQEFNEKKRIKLYHRFHEILHEEQPYTFMFTSSELVAVSRRFENVKVHTRGLFYDEWKVKKK